MTLQENGYGADRIETDVDRRDQGADRRGRRNFQREVPALERLKLVIELELRGRGDIQLFRVEVPGAEGHARHRVGRQGPPLGPALALQRARARGQGAPLARGVRVRHGEGQRAGRDPQADPERRGEAGGAHAHAQAQDAMSLRMPAEWAPHERTIMCWPARETMWRERFAQAEDDYAAVANAIAAFEPVLMAADPRFAAERRAPVRRAASRSWSSPLDDSWARDSGPIFVTDGDGDRARGRVRLQRLGREVRALRRGRRVREARARAPGGGAARRRATSCSRAARSRSTARAR